jgi:hypothetical protein
MVAQINYKMEVSMYAIRIAALIWAAAFACAQGTKPKAEPSDYPAHVALDNSVTLAAEYMVHSIPTPTGSLVAEDYLVVDVAFFGPAKTKLDLDAGQFALRINNQKVAFRPDSAGSVAASIKYTDYSQRPGLTGSAGAGAGNAGVVWGPSNTPRFPGDPSAGRPLPNPVPDQTDPNVPPMEAEAPIEVRIQGAALEEGARVLPKSGLIFFPHRGRTKSIKSLELIYEGPAGKVSLKLL